MSEASAADWEGYEPDQEDPEDQNGHPTVRGAQIRRAAMRKRPPAILNQQRGGNVTRRIQAMEKQRRALEMRKAGATYHAIAQAVGYGDASAARKAIERAIADVIQEPAQEVRTIQIERLNHMLLTLWPKVQAGDERAIDTALRVMDKLDRLMGTDSASQVDVNVHHDGAVLVIDGDKDAFIRQMKKMAGVQDIPSQEVVPSGDVQVGEPKELGAGDVPSTTIGSTPSSYGRNGVGPSAPASVPDPAPTIIDVTPTSVNTRGKFNFAVEPGVDDEDDK